jgi:hypothetical protein
VERVTSGNVPTRLAGIATLVTWVTIPFLWSFNTWGVLSLVEAYWLLFVVCAWLLAVAGLTRKGAIDGVAPITVFVWSSVIPTVLLLLVLLAYALDPGSGGVD